MKSQTSTADLTAEAPKASHQVTVEDYSKTTFTEGTSEYTQITPKLIVDGKEATDINSKLNDYIQAEYPLEKNGDYVNGYTTRYEWGYKDNVVSIVIYASYKGEDYFTCEVFNYDLDTLQPLESGEVTKRFAMTDDVLFSKAADIYTDFCDGKSFYDLEKSIASINYDNLTPFIMPDGNPGVAGGIYYSSDSLFSGSVSVRIFNLPIEGNGNIK